MVRSVTVTGRRKKHDYSVWFGKNDDKRWVAEVTVEGAHKGTCELDYSDRPCGTVAERLVDKAIAGEPLKLHDERLRIHTP